MILKATSELPASPWVAHVQCVMEIANKSLPVHRNHASLKTRPSLKGETVVRSAMPFLPRTFNHA